MASWTFTPVAGALGRFQVIFTKPGGKPTDVTFFRSTPMSIGSYSGADPFGDAAAVLSFPQITGYDDLTGADVGSWLAPFAQVEIYWVTYASGLKEVDPRTNEVTLAPQGRKRLWEGYVASIDLDLDESGSRMNVQCQGANYQVDRYMAKPAFPARPVPHERLIASAFSHSQRPHLRTKPLLIEWPKGWTKKVPGYTKTDAYTPDARPNTKYTGFSTRDTGGWVHALTDHVAGLLRVMFVDDSSGVVPGNQWTIRQDPGRQPVLYVRDRFKAPDIALWFGQVGVKGSFSLDGTQIANIIYGTGTAIDGSGWSNQVISSDGRSTGYAPLAALRSVYPAKGNKAYDKTAFAAEAKHEFMSGFALDQALASANKSLIRDSEPGWTGDITLSVDPSECSRWAIRAGMTLLLKGFVGSGETGVPFHIAQVQANPEAGTMTLTMDTRYRDLADVEEIRMRQRDPLTPTKMLRVGQRSVMLEDISAPWDYTAGSGFIPLGSTKMHAVRPADEVFPWKKFVKAHPPRRYSNWYVRVNASSTKRADRWTIFPILMSQKGTIRRLEIACYDNDGNVVAVPFHFSAYYTKIELGMLPHDGAGPSPFLTNAFEKIDTAGMIINSNLWPPPNVLIQGWGNKDQPAGYSPGRKSDGAAPNGLLVDESSWSFDSMGNPNFFRDARPGQTIPPSVVTIFGAVYAEHTTPIYIAGRLYRAEPGS